MAKYKEKKTVVLAGGNGAAFTHEIYIEDGSVKSRFVVNADQFIVS